MEVVTVPMLQDNLGYLVRCTETRQVFFVDISHSSVDKVYGVLEEYDALNENLIILTTHKHADHSGGNLEASRIFSQRFDGRRLAIYGDGVIDRTPGVTHSVGDGDVIHVGNLTIRVLQTPCHTRGSLCYHVTTTTDGDHPGALFTGDTLFVGGIGAFFEGNAEAMVAIFQRLLQEIPRPTLLYCGHDYALNFLPNALSRDPSNEHLAARLSWAQQHRSDGTPAMPSTFEDELQTNLFLRVVSHTAEMAKLYPQWDPHLEKPLASLMSLVYDTV